MPLDAHKESSFGLTTVNPSTDVPFTRVIYVHVDSDAALGMSSAIPVSLQFSGTTTYERNAPVEALMASRMFP